MKIMNGNDSINGVPPKRKKVGVYIVDHGLFKELKQRDFYVSLRLSL